MERALKRMKQNKICAKCVYRGLAEDLKVLSKGGVLSCYREGKVGCKDYRRNYEKENGHDN